MRFLESNAGEGPCRGVPIARQAHAREKKKEEKEKEKKIEGRLALKGRACRPSPPAYPLRNWLQPVDLEATFVDTRVSSDKGLHDVPALICFSPIAPISQ